jgi:hypothetical protein
MADEPAAPAVAPDPEFDQNPKSALQEAATEPPALGDAGKRAIDAMKAERDEARRQAKAHERELEKVRTAALSDGERAVAEAKSAGRSEALAEVGKRLVRSEMKAAAATAGVDLTATLDYLDLGRFVSEDGEPDDKLIAKYIATLTPPQAAASATPPARRPVEQLLPGATPSQPAVAVDDAYPSNWLTPSQSTGLDGRSS